MAISPVSILIRWGRVPCINRNSNITGYIVVNRTSDGTAMNVSVSGTDLSERTYTATPLAFNTSYFIEIAAVTNTGVTGSFSATVTETTSPPISESVICVHVVYDNLMMHLSVTEDLHLLTHRCSGFERCYHPKPWFCTLEQYW